MTALPRPQGEKKLFNLNDDYVKNSRQSRLVEVGLLHTEDYSHSFSSGKWVYTITRIDQQTGDVFGVYHSGDVYELDIEDCI